MTRSMAASSKPYSTSSGGVLAVVERLLGGRRFLILYAIVPVVIYGVVLWIYPVGYGMIMSFTDWNPMSVYNPSFVGLENYRRAFDTPLVWKAIANSLKYAAFRIGFGTPLALGVALLLNSLRKGRSAFRLAFFLPVVTSMIAAGIIWKFLYQPRFGMLNGALLIVRDASGLSFSLPRYLRDPRLALLCISVMMIWKNLGYTMVILLAGLSGIPSEYYEAARIDGAGRWTLFRHITIPLLQQTLVFVLVTGIAGSIQAFTEIYVMTSGAQATSGGATLGGPVNSTLTIVVEIYQRAFRLFEFGYASALAVIIFVVITSLSLAQLWLGRMRWEY